MSILSPGKNCLPLARATEARVLVDGSHYFSAFREACERAQSHIIIIGWDLDFYTLLHPGVLGEFLRDRVKQNKKLHVYLLTWDYSAVYVNERGRWSEREKLWRGRSRLHLVLDDVHPFGGSQHQKIVVVDDSVAFCGGMDLSQARWDTPAHAPDDPERVFHAGDPYAAFHDVHMMVGGPAAAALGEVARARWKNATGRALRLSAVPMAWPIAEVDFRDVDVGISRTLPAFESQAEVSEVHRLYVDSIAAAERFIYCENQYLTSGSICRALLASLAQEHGPQIVIIGPAAPSGWLEQNTMGTLRANLVSRLREGDKHGRLRLYYPSVGDTPLNLHAKVMIIDDRFLRVGSSNLSNRSLGLDSECDLAIETDVSAIRVRLMSEHLGTEVPKELGLFEAIDRCNVNVRHLVELPPPEPALLASLISEEAFFDSEKPAAAARAVDMLLRGENDPVDRRPFMIASAILAALLVIAALWRFTPLNHWIAPQQIAHVANYLRSRPLAVLWLAGAFAGASVLLIPVTLLIIQCGVLLGAPLGIAVSFLGVFAGLSLGFGLGRVASRRMLVRLAGHRLRRLDGAFSPQRLALRGDLTRISDRAVHGGERHRRRVRVQLFRVHRRVTARHGTRHRGALVVRPRLLRSHRQAELGRRHLGAARHSLRLWLRPAVARPPSCA